MPPKVSKKRAVRKGRKNYGRKRQIVNVNKALTPFAQRYITKMKYSETLTLSLANSYQYVFNLNSLYDPNRTGIGHQPYGFDNLAMIYNRYRIFRTDYVINGYSGAVPIRYGCIVSNDVPPINNVSELAENPRAQTRVQVPGGNTTRIAGRVSLPSLVGRNKQQYMADDRYQADVTSSPAELALLTITGGTMTDASTDILVTVTLVYHVEFFDAKPIEQS